jgi:hypothetical protein
MFELLHIDKILGTVKRLHARIRQHFPDAGLTMVAAELTFVAEDSGKRIRAIYGKSWTLRVLIVLLLVAIAALVIVFLRSWLSDATHSLDIAKDVGGLFQALESVLGAAFFLSAAVVSLVTLEKRFIRARALRAIQELRAMAHIIDLHQLQKDPEQFVIQRAEGDATTITELSVGQMARYLDFCTELLSLVGNVAVIYAQPSNDPVVHEAGDDLQQLAGSLASKIWQKIMILDRIAARQNA